ncbi:MAG: hypothetical protein DRR19_28185 [Candidatus Parabeggiatoa sp. nov. 1]|nr:MAG: hypothetical protein DRR19_28185 [Gammaproteobacteria bacterium]
MRLLMYRHKIMWAYNQSRLLKKRLKAKVVTIQTCHQEVSHNSTSPLDFKAIQKTLQTAWETLPPYTTDLSGLIAQIRTIEINLTNYQKRLSRLGKKAGQPLKLKHFSKMVQDKYLRQVQKDHANLQPNLKVLENLIGYIKTTVAIWGIGLAVGAIVASISGQFPTMNQTVAINHPLGSLLANYLPHAWVAPAISVILSVGSAIAAGLVTKIWIGLRHR